MAEQSAKGQSGGNAEPQPPKPALPSVNVDTADVRAAVQQLLTALGAKTEPAPPDDIMLLLWYHALCREEVITPDEFNRKKRQLLEASPAAKVSGGPTAPTSTPTAGTKVGGASTTAASTG